MIGAHLYTHAAPLTKQGLGAVPLRVQVPSLLA